MKICLTSFLMAVCLTAMAEQPGTYTWSSTNCPRCQSTIVYQAWYPDGSPLVAEGMSGTNAGALAALSLMKDTLVLSLGLSISRGPMLTLALRESVTLETDSSSHTVLYAQEEPGPGFHKDDVAVLRSLNIRSLPLRPYAPASGFLFFPFDARATHFVVVVRVGDEVFHFPFAQDPKVRARFGDPSRLAAAPTDPVAPGVPVASARAQTCSETVSFAVSEDGQLVARMPDFAHSWLQKNASLYPGVCFTQTPDTRLANYLVAFAPSASAFDGFSPSVNAPATVAPGANADNLAAAWTYHYTGTGAGTTSTTTYVSLPWAEKTRSLYAYTYDQNGQVVSRRERAVTSRRGIGPASSVGLSVAAAISASHLKEKLLDDAMHDLAR